MAGGDPNLGHAHLVPAERTANVNPRINSHFSGCRWKQQEVKRK